MTACSIVNADILYKDEISWSSSGSLQMSRLSFHCSWL